MDLFFQQPLGTLPANQYEVNLKVLQCSSATTRIVVSSKNTVTVDDLTGKCTYSIHVTAKDTYTELFNFTRIPKNFTTKHKGKVFFFLQH